MIKQSRRRFISGAAAIICAPAIVRIGSLMPVRSVIIDPPYDLRELGLGYEVTYQAIGYDEYGDFKSEILAREIVYPGNTWKKIRGIDIIDP